MLYVFAGFPGKNATTGFAYLNAGGLQHCIEEVERLAQLEHDPMIQYAKEGVYAIPRGSNVGERLGPVQYRLSPLLEAQGIIWDWFPENWGFGNGVTMHKSTANFELKTVVHGTDMTLDQYLTWHWNYGKRPIPLAELALERSHHRTEGWEKYEARWKPGTCPQYSHIVHLTWFVTKEELDRFAYNRIQRLIEDPSAVLVDVERYREKDFSPTHKWDGKGESNERLELLRGLR